MTRHVHGRIVGDGEEADAVRPLPVSALGTDDAIIALVARASDIARDSGAKLLVTDPGVVAAGLIAFALYSFADVRYRKI